MEDIIEIPKGTTVRILANAFDAPMSEFTFEGKTGVLAFDLRPDDIFADVRVEDKSGTWCMFRKEFRVI